MHNKLTNQNWEAIPDAFNQWIKENEYHLNPGLRPEPTIKILIFLALLEAKKACTYEEIQKIFKAKNVIGGDIPKNTLRTSILNLGKTLDKVKHPLALHSSRGMFLLIKRNQEVVIESVLEPIVLLLDPPTIKAEDIAYEVIEKARLPFHALYFLERAARWWEIFSHGETQIRVQYESEAWEQLGIRNRLLSVDAETISFVALAPGEGFAEIELLKKILIENKEVKVHYVAIDSSQRLLREHINLLKESLAAEVNNNRIICVGVIADIFCTLHETIQRVRRELIKRSLINQEQDFIPETSGLLVTYLGNCLGNCYQDQETEIFSIIYSTFKNRPLEFLVGVSVMRSMPDEYKRNWDDFLLQTPKHLLETNKLLESSRPADCKLLAEFNLPENGDSKRCPIVIPESYIVRHGIKGQIYRFYYRLAYDLSLSSVAHTGLRPLPKGTLILLYNIVKYTMNTLVHGIETCGLFKVEYNKNYHQMVDTPNGKREYAVFSAYLKK